MIIAKENVIQQQLVEGKMGRWDKLGSFYTSLSSHVVADPASFTADMIKNKKVIYLSGYRIMDALKVDYCKRIEPWFLI